MKDEKLGEVIAAVARCHTRSTTPPAPQPYAIAHLGHAHLLKPPGWPMADAEAA